MKNSYFYFFAVCLCLLGCKEEIKTRSTLDYCLPANLQNGVIAFYPFTTGRYRDESGNQNNLLENSFVLGDVGRGGIEDCAFTFDNRLWADAYLKADNSSFLNGNASFSISFWYKFIDSIYYDNQTLVRRGNVDYNCIPRTGEWSVGITDGRAIYFAHDNRVTGFHASPVPEDYYAYSSTHWMHLVVVKDNEQFLIYTDGSLSDSTSGLANCTDPHLAEDVGDLFIGEGFNGSMDDVIFYNRAIPADQVWDLFNVSPCCR